ncbi:hypothetical protein [Pontibacter sp. G13]|uniref:hypothetical protein n=1 Tax=Pontibacter sp. G13 TaxID=3074898 RepID=UPI0028891FD7|nr:hypothetical protein [Pontibacter sp. G13]WNJ21330.1 hypothetical protein RJD25_12745 [Pontibacter sp. G13]
MEELLLRLQTLHSKVSQLETVNQELSEVAEDLQSENETLRQSLDGRTRELEALKERYEALKLVKSLHSLEDREIVRGHLDRFIQEIEICLKNFGGS